MAGATVVCGFAKPEGGMIGLKAADGRIIAPPPLLYQCPHCSAHVAIPPGPGGNVRCFCGACRGYFMVLAPPAPPPVVSPYPVIAQLVEGGAAHAQGNTSSLRSWTSLAVDSSSSPFPCIPQQSCSHSGLSLVHRQ